MFWVERLARRIGFNTLSESLLGDERYAPYVFMMSVLFIDVPVLSTINYVRGHTETLGSLWWRWPGLVWWLLPITVVSILFFLRSLRKRYNTAVREAGKNDDEIINPEPPRRLQYGMLILGLVIYFAWFLTAIEPIFESAVLVIGLIKFLLFIPVVYLPLGTDFAMAYAHVQLVLPLRIHKANISLDFSDPRHLGGMYSVGRSMRFAAISVFIPLILYTVFTGASIWAKANTTIPGMEPAPQMSQSFTVLFFALAWTSATGSFLIGLYIVHRHMRNKRQEQLDQCYEEIRKLGEDNETLPYTEPSNNAEFQEYMREYVNLDRVERTSTFPFNVIVAWEMFAAALFPVVLQVISIVASSSL